MAQEFLDRLLSAHNTLNPSTGIVVQANCMICLENYNTLNTSTGIVEWEVRLPCGHGVGSSCIVTWLRANNSCPACRRTFFPAQPRPYLEHGIMEVGGTRPVRVPTGPGAQTGSRARPATDPTGSEDTDLLIVELESITRALRGSESVGVRSERELPTRLRRELGVIFGEPVSTVIIVAASMIPLIKLNLPNEDLRSKVALSFYIASHLLRRPKSPEEASGVFGVRPDRIRHVYSLGWFNRKQFLHRITLELIAGNRVDGMVAFLPPPDPDDGIIDAEEERHELQRRNTSLQLITDETDDLCIRYSQTFGGVNNYFISIAISRNSLLEHHLRLRSPRLKAAIGVYMATHLLGCQLISGHIAHVMSINAGTFKTVYARAYHVRNELIKPSMLRRIASEHMARALEAMPALNWPPLFERLVART